MKHESADLPPTIYVLWFNPGGDLESDALLIGVYESHESAAGAIERLSSKPGFVEAPAGFEICPYGLGVDHWTDGFVRA